MVGLLCIHQAFADAAFIRMPDVIPILGMTIKLSNSVESDYVPVRRCASKSRAFIGLVTVIS